jgi:ABC-2 type transport system permease protein
MISKGQYINFAVGGGLIGLITSIAISEVGDYVFLRKELKLQELLVATGIKPIDYILGMSIGNLIFSLPAIIFYIILGIFLNILNLLNIIEILILCIILMISLSSLAFLISTYVKYSRYSWGIAGVLSVFLSVIPPIYYPYTNLNEIALYILLIIPSTPASIIAQTLLGLQSSIVDYNLALIILIFETVIYTILAIKYSRWSEI